MVTEESSGAGFVARLKPIIPILSWLPDYNRDWLRPDILAGITLAAFSIPEAMAYAGLAGLPPQAGLYACIAAPLIYMVLGTSRQLSIGVTSAVSVLVSSGLAFYVGGDPVRYAQLAAALAIMVFVIALIARLLRLGFLVNFISEPVLLGFSSGAALYIASTQLSKLFGIHGCEGEFFERIACVLTNLNETHIPSLVLGLVGIAVLLVGEHFWHTLPWSLIVVLGSILAMNYTGLGGRGIAVAGEIPQGLPSFEFPPFSLQELRLLLPTALAVFLLAYVEGMSMARTFSSKHGYRIDSDQELLAMSFANLGAGLTQGYPVAGSMSRSALADSAGAKSQLAGGIAALLIAVVVMFFTGFFTNLPEPILASVVLVAVTGLFKRAALTRLFYVQRKEFWIAILALLGVLFFGMLEGVLIGVIISLLVLIGRVSQSRLSVLGRVPETVRLEDVREHPEYLTVPGLMMIRIDELLFFANATPISEEIEHLVATSKEPLQGVLIDLELSDELDISSVEMLAELAQGLSVNGIHLMLSRVSPAARDLLDRSGVTDLIGPENFYPRSLAAVADFLEDQDMPLTKVNTMTNVLLVRIAQLYDKLAARAAEPEHTELEAIAAELNEMVDRLNVPADDTTENP